MKSFKYIIAFSILLGFGSMSGQSLTEAFKNQAYTTIKEQLSPTVSVKMNNSSKAEGSERGMRLIEKVLSNFQPIRMESKHKGSSEAEDSDYLIAKLFNANNEALRIFIHLENSSSGKKICDVKMREL